MSISSACSSVSVTLNGKEIPLEQALDETVRSLQQHLNKVQLQLRMLGMGSDRDDDFEDQIKEADKMQDEILEMTWLFDDLSSMAYEIVGEPETKEEKLFLKQHKIERKAYLSKMKTEHAEQKKKEKDEAKLSKQLESKMEL